MECLMNYVNLEFENPVDGSVNNFRDKCHSLDSDIGKFAIARFASSQADQVEFLNKNHFHPIEDLNQLLLDNRVTLFDDIHAALLKKCAIERLNAKSDFKFSIYKVSVIERNNDTVTLCHLKTSTEHNQ